MLSGPPSECFYLTLYKNQIAFACARNPPLDADRLAGPACQPGDGDCPLHLSRDCDARHGFVRAGHAPGHAVPLRGDARQPAPAIRPRLPAPLRPANTPRFPLPFHPSIEKAPLAATPVPEANPNAHVAALPPEAVLSPCPAPRLDGANGVVFILDISGSMYEPYAGSTRLACARQILAGRSAS